MVSPTSGDVAALGHRTRVDVSVESYLSRVGAWFRIGSLVVSVPLGFYVLLIDDSSPSLVVSGLVILASFGTALIGRLEHSRALWGTLALGRLSAGLAATGGLIVSIGALGSGTPEGALSAAQVMVPPILALLGFGVLLDSARRGGLIVPAQLAALGATTLSAALVLEPIYILDGSHETLFPTIRGLALLLVSAGALLMRPGSGLVSVVASSGPGGRLLRRVGPLTFVVPAVVIWLIRLGPIRDRSGLVALVAAGIGLAMLVLIALLARVVDRLVIGASAAAAEAERARAGLSQEAPLVADLTKILHIVEVDDVEGWRVSTRYRPASGSVAGDASVVRSLPGGSIGFVLVDVTGHGAGPAMDAIRLRDRLLHTLALGDDPAAALESAGWSEPEDLLASAVVLVVDASSGRLVVASAGHPPVLLIDDHATQMIGPTGPLLFLEPQSRYRSLVDDISSGDTIVVFSDGIADVQRMVGNRTEPEALADLLWVEGGNASEMADIAVGFASSPPADDQTVVVIQRL